MEFVVEITDTERAVLCCAIEYYLEEGIEYAPTPSENVEESLEAHHKSATNESIICVRPGMEEFYQTVFREYARALQETVDEEEASDSMGEFFEGAFKGVVGKIRNTTEF